jgi:2-desacetyl-2-hydroxyethyl bacteriochlorophyllide A dehydrogenase
MKAPVFKAIGQPLAVETVTDPTPGAGELVIRVSRCGICGTDLHKSASLINPFKPGTVIGHEFCGEVVALGPRVNTHKIGDRVAVMPLNTCGRCGPCLAGDLRWCEHGPNIWYGGAAQFALCKAHASIKLPAQLSLEDGALIEPLAVSLHGVSMTQVGAESKILILGTGAIGLATIFWARRLGAVDVVASSRSRRNEHLAMQFGAAGFVTFEDDFQRQIETKLRGRPDMVFECIGQPGMLSRAVNAVRERGSVVLLGNCMEPDLITPSIAMFKEVRIQGSTCYAVRDFENCARMFDSGHVDPAVMVTDTVTYANLPEVFESLRLPGSQCKVMITPWS